MRIRVETAAFADAIAQAHRLASGRNDHLSGVLVSAEPGAFTVSSTNGELTFRRKLTIFEDLFFDDTATRRWYLPGKTAAKLFARFPLGENSTVEMEDNEAGQVVIQCKKIKAKLNVLDDSVFPHIPIYSTDQLAEVEGMAKRLKQVTFASSPKNEGPLGGIHVTGEYLEASDGNRFARMELEVPVDEPVVLPLAPLGGILKNTDAVHMGYVGGRFVFQTDIETQITSTIIDAPFPNCSGFQDLRETWCDGTAKFGLEDMKNALGRMIALAEEDDTLPRVRFRFDADRVRIGMNVPEIGQMTDEIDAECDGNSALTYAMNPGSLLDVLAVWPSPTVPLEYCTTTNLKPYTVANDAGFLTMWMGMKD